MPLLQIAEPGMSEVPHSVHLAVGIDLGTTNSLVATVKNGEAVVLEDEKGSALLPSVVRYLADGTVQVGREALQRAAEDPQNTDFQCEAADRADPFGNCGSFASSVPSA